eukprot:1403209-Pyramimonas_sp.AAC.1
MRRRWKSGGTQWKRGRDRPRISSSRSAHAGSGFHRRPHRGRGRRRDAGPQERDELRSPVHSSDRGTIWPRLQGACTLRKPFESSKLTALGFGGGGGGGGGGRTEK